MDELTEMAAETAEILTSAFVDLYETLKVELDLQHPSLTKEEKDAVLLTILEIIIRGLHAAMHTVIACQSLHLPNPSDETTGETE